MKQKSDLVSVENLNGTQFNFRLGDIKKNLLEVVSRPRFSRSAHLVLKTIAVIEKDSLKISEFAKYIFITLSYFLSLF